MNFKNIEIVIDKYINEIIEFRRDIHSHPELSGNEERTSKKVIEKLKKLPIEIISNVNGHGVIGNLKGISNKKTILLRSDMDALPIDEMNDLEYKSKNKNVMHACGHDIHTSILLGTALVLSEFKEELNGNVKFMFQPSEEASPIGGAKGMIAEGLLENPKVDEAYGLHVFGIPTGKIAIKSGVATSRSDRIDIEIFGKSSHASMPAEGKDTIVVAGNIITSIQSIISRNMPPNQTAVITIGKISGGTRYNVLADYVKLEGTVRTFSTENAEMIKNRLEELVTNISKAYGCKGILHYQNGYDFIYNNPELSTSLINSLSEEFGKENILIQDNPLPAGEDFSFVSKKVPSVFMWLGTENSFNTGRCTLHSPDFMPDENSIKIGIKTFCKIIFDRLR